MKLRIVFVWTIAFVIELLFNASALAGDQSGSASAILASFAAKLPPLQFRCGTGISQEESLQIRHERAQLTALEDDAISQLRSLGASAYTTLAKNLNNKDIRVQLLCARALQAFGAATMPAVVQVLKEGEGTNISWGPRYHASAILKSYDAQTRLVALSQLLATGNRNRTLCWATVADVTRKYRGTSVNDEEGDLLAQYAPHFAIDVRDSDEALNEPSAYLLQRCAPRISNKDVCATVARAMSSILDSPATEDLRLRKQLAMATISRLQSVPPDAAASLTRSVDNTDPRIASMAASNIIILAHSNPSAHLKSISAVLNSEQESRLRGLRQLSFWRNDHDKVAAVVPLLVQLGNNPRAQTQQDLKALAETLREFRADAAPSVPLLNNMLSNQNIDVRRAACEALGAIGSMASPALPGLQQLRAKTSEKWVYISASRAIRQITGDYSLEVKWPR